MGSPSVSIVIPTYGRDQVLVDTVRALLALVEPSGEILVIDQSPSHAKQTVDALERWELEGAIRWIRLQRPSITVSMNHGLREARGEYVLFLDDDIVPRGELVGAHAALMEQDADVWASVGQVIQPWQQPEDVPAPRKFQGLRRDEDFPFHSTREMDVSNVMAGNLCVRRAKALALGGFDENFQGAAYRFETEFARRVIHAGGRIRFLGCGGIDHLRAERGGTRSAGSHLTSASPAHGVGDHYYALRHATSRARANLYCLRRMFREVRTKFHLRHPWWIPVKLVGEVRGYFEARRLIGAMATDVRARPGANRSVPSV